MDERSANIMLMSQFWHTSRSQNSEAIVRGSCIFKCDSFAVGYFQNYYAKCTRETTVTLVNSIFKTYTNDLLII